MSTGTSAPFSMTFEDFVKLKAKISKRSLMIGLPFSLTGFMGSSFVCAMTMPDLTPDKAPENIELVMCVRSG